MSSTISVYFKKVIYTQKCFKAPKNPWKSIMPRCPWLTFLLFPGQMSSCWPGNVSTSWIMSNKQTDWTVLLINHHINQPQEKTQGPDRKSLLLLSDCPSVGRERQLEQVDAPCWNSTTWRGKLLMQLRRESFWHDDKLVRAHCPGHTEKEHSRQDGGGMGKVKTSGI